MRASLYVRLSKAAGDTNTSREGMVAELRDLCKREGLTEVALHIDDGQTGAIRDRPEFVAWLDDARHGRCDVLAAHHVDRMTREGLNVAAQILDVVEGKDPTTGRAAHAPVRLVDTKGLDSRDGDSFRFQFVVKAEIARAERARIADRNRAKDKRLRNAGRYTGSVPPYGYRPVPAPDGRGKVLTLAEDEAEAIREAAQMILAGHTPGRVCRWMNANGHKTRKGGQWHRTSLLQVLRGDAILGAVTSEGKVLRDVEGRMFTPFPAALDLPTALAVRAALAPKETRVFPGRQPARLLSRIITCDSCGRYLRVSQRTSGTPAYRCSTRTDGNVCERPASVNAEAVERYVEAEFLAGVGRAPMYRQRTVVNGAAALAELDDRIAATLAELGTAATPEAFARLQCLQAERAEAEKAPQETRVELVPTGRSLADEWQARDVEGRREILSGAVDVMALKPVGRGKVFTPERLTLVWAEGDHDPD